MTITYVLHENHLTSDPNDYMAMVQPNGTAEMEAVIQRMIEQGSTVTRADIFSVLEDYHSALESLVLEGFNVLTPCANFGASIKGIFDGQADIFDPARHRVWPNVVPGTRLRTTVVSRGQTTKGEAVMPRPNLLEFIDINSGERNSVLTPGGMAQLIGHRLKFDPADAQQGVFFIAGDGAETSVEVVGRNKPAELMFLIPDTLTTGDYTMEVRVVIRDGANLRTGRLEAALTAA